jgi:hypothetical protein
MVYVFPTLFTGMGLGSLEYRGVYRGIPRKFHECKLEIFSYYIKKEKLISRSFLKNIGEQKSRKSFHKKLFSSFHKGIWRWGPDARQLMSRKLRWQYYSVRLVCRGVADSEEPGSALDSAHEHGSDNTISTESPTPRALSA